MRLAAGALAAVLATSVLATTHPAAADDPLFIPSSTPTTPGTAVTSLPPRPLTGSPSTPPTVAW